MFCKYCATKLGQEISQKCPNCGLVIDVNDGGQSFYEDADLLAWSMTNEEAMASMPKTEVRRIVHQKPPRGGMSAAKGKSKQVNNNTFANPEMPFVDDGKMSVVKIGIICIAAVVIVLLAVLWFFVKGYFDDKVPTETSNTKNEQVEEPIPTKNEFSTLVGMVAETTTGFDEKDPKEDAPIDDPDVETLPSTGEYVTLYVYENVSYGYNSENNSIEGLVKQTNAIGNYNVYLYINGVCKLLDEIHYDNSKTSKYLDDCIKNDTHNGFHLHEINPDKGKFEYWYFDTKTNVHKQIKSEWLDQSGTLDCIDTFYLADVFGYNVIKCVPSADEDHKDSYKLTLQKVS